MNAERGIRGPYRIETAPGSAPAPPPSRDLSVEVAVVGGGVAGLGTAREPARRGHEVAVLEADRIAAVSALITAITMSTTVIPTRTGSTFHSGRPSGTS
ncbi:FAD-dependent oxidoreductase [Streptomyces sp. NPDC005820]|uniref:FAD-dependent oxidoreductase n=1 Tax=Streptomyces sp. NPDC005820 TaxID=3157069 RepID=UPI0033F1F3E2